MGFNSNFTGKNQKLECETLEYIESVPEIGIPLTELMLKLNKAMPQTQGQSYKNGIKVRVYNRTGEDIFLTVVGVNSTSLISSEMDGHLAFTFIRSLLKISFINDRASEEEKRFSLVK